MVSGLTEQSRERYGESPREVETYLPILDHCWSSFGADRLIYGSNWPVCEKGGSYADQFHVVSRYFESKGSEACEKYFWKNALSAYRWRE
jgi:L-fuconolactonase